MNDDVIRIARFRSDYEADMAKVVLNGSGIAAEVVPIPTEGDGGASVLVRKEDKDEAREILRSSTPLTMEGDGVEPRRRGYRR